MLFLTAEFARITVDDGLTIEEQRIRVAHELAHILLAFEMTGRGIGLPNRANPEHEQWCQDFQRQLCMLLHHLYTETDYVKKNNFESLGEVCKANADHLREKMKGISKKRKRRL